MMTGDQRLRDALTDALSEPAFYYIDELARHWRRSEHTVRWWLATGVLKSRKMGRRRVIDRDEVARFEASGGQAEPKA